MLWSGSVEIDGEKIFGRLSSEGSFGDFGDQTRADQYPGAAPQDVLDNTTQMAPVNKFFLNFEFNFCCVISIQVSFADFLASSSDLNQFEQHLCHLVSLGNMTTIRKPYLIDNFVK